MQLIFKKKSNTKLNNHTNRNKKNRIMTYCLFYYIIYKKYTSDQIHNIQVYMYIIMYIYKYINTLKI